MPSFSQKLRLKQSLSTFNSPGNLTEQERGVRRMKQGAGERDNPKDTEETVTIKCNWSRRVIHKEVLKIAPSPRQSKFYSVGHRCNVLNRDALKWEARGDWHRGDVRGCQVVPVWRCRQSRPSWLLPYQLGQEAGETDQISCCALGREVHRGRYHG